ncbi:hypothetical protein Pfo_002812 [Paulownia fortunei]|nr:hypothetical protein Pfo_002812 [Paulownia fortunei]
MVSGFDPLTIQVGLMDENAGTKNALLNGLEVLKINNSVGSLDGEFCVNGDKVDGSNAAKGTGGCRICNDETSFLSSSKTSLGSRRSQSFSSAMGLGLYFSLAELQKATKNWDPSAIIGVGGFGNVYLRVIDDGTKVAIKRGNPQSEQGINEFQTEIQMMSKLRQRHLEMILVYDYMSNGPFGDHLYGKDLPPLSWKKRLKICIGAALHPHWVYSGRRTTNILIDENFVAKMADLKDAHTTEQDACEHGREREVLGSSNSRTSRMCTH